MARQKKSKAVQKSGKKATTKKSLKKKSFKKKAGGRISRKKNSSKRIGKKSVDSHATDKSTTKIESRISDSSKDNETSFKRIGIVAITIVIIILLYVGLKLELFCSDKESTYEADTTFERLKNLEKSPNKKTVMLIEYKIQDCHI